MSEVKYECEYGYKGTWNDTPMHNSDISQFEY